MNIKNLFVVPAKAGIQSSKTATVALDPRFRGGDVQQLIIREHLGSDTYCVSNQEFCAFYGSARCSKGISEGPGESDDEASSHGRNRVWDVALGSDRRCLWVGNRRE
jgi:hypothetical protein